MNIQVDRKPDRIENPVSDMHCRIALIMPVYNEADTIKNTVREFYRKVVDKMGNVDIWVFEDGSYGRR